MSVQKGIPLTALTGRFYFLLRNSGRLMSMLWDISRGRYAPPAFVRVTIALCLVYILFPFDLIPGFIPLLGWLDDGLVYYLTLRLLNKALAHYARHRRNISGPLPFKGNS